MIVCIAVRMARVIMASKTLLTCRRWCSAGTLPRYRRAGSAREARRLIRCCRSCRCPAVFRLRRSASAVRRTLVCSQRGSSGRSTPELRDSTRRLRKRPRDPGRGEERGAQGEAHELVSGRAVSVASSGQRGSAPRQLHVRVDTAKLPRGAAPAVGAGCGLQRRCAAWQALRPRPLR